MNVLIVDDEVLARQRLRNMLEGLHQHDTISEADDGEKALQKTQAMNPDIVLLDIRMPGMDGIETAQYLNKLNNPPAIIFTTAYADHALEAFEAHAVDYLLKPIKQERLGKALTAAKRLTRAQISNLRNTESSNLRSKICVKTRGRLELVPLGDIIYFMADHKYVTLRTADHEYLIEESLKSLEQEFDQRFTRIHRNALVANSFMRGMSKNGGGHNCIVMNDVEDILEISRRHLPAVRKKLKALSLEY